MIGQNLEQGTLEATERPLDVALTTPGYIKCGGGRRRHPDPRRQPADRPRRAAAHGDWPGAPAAGAIPKGVDPEDICIAPDGTVSAGKRTLGRIALVEVTNPDGLQADGENGFLPTAAGGPVRAARGARVQQGAWRPPTSTWRA